MKLFKREILAHSKEINGVNVAQSLVAVSADDLKNIIFEMRKEIENIAIVIGCNNANKPTLIVALSDDLVASGKNAGNIVREAAKEIQGGGGGQAFFATAGGKNTDGLNAAIAKAIKLATE